MWDEVRNSWVKRTVDGDITLAKSIDKVQG